MEKEQQKIEHSRYLESIKSSTDRNKMVDEYLPRLIAIAKQQGLPIEDNSLLTKQRIENDTANARIVKGINKEKECHLNDKRKAMREHISKKKELCYITPDENNIMNEYSYNQEITFEKFNKLHESRFKIVAKLGDIIDTLINDGALDDLPDVRTDTKAFDKAFYKKYNNTTLHFLYPNDGKSPSHLFPIKIVWRL